MHLLNGNPFLRRSTPVDYGSALADVVSSFLTDHGVPTDTATAATWSVLEPTSDGYALLTPDGIYDLPATSLFDSWGYEYLHGSPADNEPLVPHNGQYAGIPLTLRKQPGWLAAVARNGQPTTQRQLVDVLRSTADCKARIDATVAADARRLFLRLYNESL